MDSELTEDGTVSGTAETDSPAAGSTVTVRPGEAIPAGAGPFAMLHGEGLTTLSGTRTGLLTQIIDGYADVAATAVQTPDDDPLLDARYDFAVETAAMLQAGFLAQAEKSGAYDLAAETDEDVYLAYARDPDEPFAGFRPGGGDDVSFAWDREVPLVLIRTDYAPFTEAPTPSGRVVFIDPATETTLLDTLNEAGLITLLHREDDA